MKNYKNKQIQTIRCLGEQKYNSSFCTSKFISKEECILIPEKENRNTDTCYEFELAGAREKVFFNAKETRCAIVTCGGLCPGLNDVIRAIALDTYYGYGIEKCYGIEYGLQGFIKEYEHRIVPLNRDSVRGIHTVGGTMLKTSRGPQDIQKIVDRLEELEISMLFLIGGDGTMRAAEKIYDEITERKLLISLIGIPKTIDNDIPYVSRSFGFDTAVAKAAEAIACAHTEAISTMGGIGIVKLMGREAGFIAANASLAMRDANFVLVPEIPFTLEGKKGLLNSLKERLLVKNHAVIVVAEGAGQNLVAETHQKDSSGNKKLQDIGLFLKEEISKFLKEEKLEHSIKYIDPSYLIRSVPANASDSLYCGLLGEYAVHAAMAGKTGMLVSYWNGEYIHLPLHLVTQGKKKLDTNSAIWQAVLSSTGQAPDMR